MLAGRKVEDKEFVVLAELLMVQLLKLDGIEAEGEARAQRKAEVQWSLSTSLLLFLELDLSRVVAYTCLVKHVL